MSTCTKKPAKTVTIETTDHTGTTPLTITFRKLNDSEKAKIKASLKDKNDQDEHCRELIKSACISHPGQAILDLCDLDPDLSELVNNAIVELYSQKKIGKITLA